jgi:hypothetical protein
MRTNAAPAPVSEPGTYVLQAGSFRNMADADRVKATLAMQGVESRIQQVTIDEDTWHRVRIGPFDDLAQLEQTRRKLRDKHIEVIVIRLVDRMRHTALLILSVLLASCASAPPSRQEKQPEPVTPATPAPQPHTAAPAPRAPLRNIDIAAVGDIMLGTTYPEDDYNRLPADDGASTFADVAPILRGADIAFGNLEGVMRDGGEPFKVCKDPSHCFLFRMPARYVQHLVNAGFDVMSLANNHARDFGEDGRSETMRILDEAGIRHSGREGDIASWQVKDSRVALIAFAPNPGSHSLLDIPAAAALVSALAAEHDVVIVSFHGGAEGPDALHLTNDGALLRRRARRPHLLGACGDRRGRESRDRARPARPARARGLSRSPDRLQHGQFRHGDGHQHRRKQRSRADPSGHAERRWAVPERAHRIRPTGASLRTAPRPEQCRVQSDALAQRRSRSAAPRFT